MGGVDSNVQFHSAVAYMAIAHHPGHVLAIQDGSEVWSSNKDLNLSYLLHESSSFLLKMTAWAIMLAGAARAFIILPRFIFPYQE